MDDIMKPAALFTVPREYGFVLIAAFLVGLLNFIHALLISRLRLRIQLPYPHTYATPTNCRRGLSSRTSDQIPSALSTFTGSTATDPLLPIYNSDSTPQGEAQYDGLTRLEYSFNCAQRAHVNYIENIATHLVALLTSGLVYPKTASIMAELWCVGRLVYLYGYMTPEWGLDGEGRKWGVSWLGPLSHYPLLLLSGWVGVEVVLGL